MFSEPDSHGVELVVIQTFFERTGQEEKSDWEDVSSHPTRAESHPHPIVGHLETTTLD